MKPTHRRLIPLWVKVIYTVYLCVLVPYYWVTYTPWNFLYLCDVALFLTFVGIWVERPLLVSMAAVGIVLPQMLWIADFLVRFVAGVHVTGMTGYMFRSDIPLFVRGLSSFHGWLPLFLLWLVWRLGHDRRALLPQAILTIAVLLVCYFFGPRAEVLADRPKWAVNVNYVFGMDDKNPQTYMPPGLWLVLMMAVQVVGFQVPTHFLFRRFAPKHAAQR